MRILIVEDEPAIGEALSYLLGAEGHQVAVATTGPEGLEQFERFAPDLMLLDLMLPGMNGLEVCRAIRRDSDVGIIIVTARELDAEKVVGLEAGADDYLTKPFSNAELLARIRAVSRRVRETHPASPIQAGIPAARTKPTRASSTPSGLSADPGWTRSR